MFLTGFYSILPVLVLFINKEALNHTIRAKTIKTIKATAILETKDQVRGQRKKWNQGILDDAKMS